MIALLILFFIGKWFYELAKKHGRNGWLYGILGVVVYYGSAIIGGFLIGFIAVMVGYEEILNWPDLALNLIAIPIGILGIMLVHRVLRKNWENNPKNQDSELLDSTDI